MVGYMVQVTGGRGRVRRGDGREGGGRYGARRGLFVGAGGVGVVLIRIGVVVLRIYVGWFRFVVEGGGFFWRVFCSSEGECA